MFDIGFWELSLIAVIALMILGPERLPQVARTAGMWIRKMKGMVNDVKTSINEELRVEELNALKQAGQDLKTGLESTKQELGSVGNEFKDSVAEVSGEIESVDITAAIGQSAAVGGDETATKDSPAAASSRADKAPVKKSAEKRPRKPRTVKTPGTPGKETAPAKRTLAAKSGKKKKKSKKSVTKNPKAERT